MKNKYENIITYLKRTKQSDEMKLSENQFMKIWKKGSKDMVKPVLLRLPSDPKTKDYTKTTHIIVDEEYNETKLCKMNVSKIKLLHDPISHRYGFTDYTNGEFVSFENEEDAINFKRKDLDAEIQARIKEDSTFKDRLQAYVCI